MVDLAAPAFCPTTYGVTCNKYQVNWKQANPSGVTIKVYAVTKCLSTPHCLKSTTLIPAADLVEVGSAAASKGSLTFIVGGGQSDGDGWMKGSGGKTLFVYSVVVRASSAAGKSAFVMAWTW